MKPRIETNKPRKLIGMRIQMSLQNNQTFSLWNCFMKRRSEISGVLNSDLISMQIYHNAFYFSRFNPANEFEKWAAVEVSSFEKIPNGMNAATIPEGLYAVFTHRGAQLTAENTFRYIFSEWLPTSEYELDNRPHFEILGEKYKNNDPNSEEEIWIPIRLKS